MKANELRIGNLVYCPEMDTNDYVSKTHFNCPELYEPIPLTEEWLLKFGFDVSVGWAEKDDFKMGQPDDDWINELWSIRYEKKYVKIQYVHQLQNLYFALTGQELV